jgi:hypothetical protein
VFFYAAKKRGLNELQHRAENHQLTLCKVFDISVLDVTSLHTFSFNLTFDDVSLVTFDVSSVFDDVSLAFEDVSPLTFNVSLLTFNLSSSFDDLSLSFDDWSARMSLACPFIFPSNSCHSDSIPLLCRAALSGSGLVSM